MLTISAGYSRRRTYSSVPPSTTLPAGSGSRNAAFPVYASSRHAASITASSKRLRSSSEAAEDGVSAVSMGMIPGPRWATALHLASRTRSAVWYRRRKTCSMAAAATARRRCRLIDGSPAGTTGTAPLAPRLLRLSATLILLVDEHLWLCPPFPAPLKRRRVHLQRAPAMVVPVGIRRAGIERRPGALTSAIARKERALYKAASRGNTAACEGTLHSRAGLLGRSRCPPW